MKTLFVLLIASTVGAFAQADAVALYAAKCATCHAADGSGNTAKGRKLKMKGVKETAVKMKAEEMIKIVTDGKGTDMDAFGQEFSRDQIKGLVDYYRGLAK